MKTCNKCGETKPKTEFSKTKANNDGLRYHCKPCDNAESKAWRNRNPNNYIKSRRKSHLKRIYGLSEQDYKTRLINQKGVCAICGEECRSGKRLSVDHDHRTGKIRGLLCVSCNVGIGYLRDNPIVLRNAADYLEVSRLKLVSNS